MVRERREGKGKKKNPPWPLVQIVHGFSPSRLQFQLPRPPPPFLPSQLFFVFPRFCGSLFFSPRKASIIFYLPEKGWLLVMLLINPFLFLLLGVRTGSAPFKSNRTKLIKFSLIKFSSTGRFCEQTRTDYIP